MLQTINKIPIWALLLLIGFITFSTSSIRIPSDMMSYMNIGLNIFKGSGYLNTDLSFALLRGPIFPFLIALSYYLFGISAQSAFFVVRIFCILNPILLYFIGKKFYGKWVGLVASLFVLTSYSMNFAAYRHIDVVIPFFIILYIFLTFHAFEKNNLYLFTLSGITLAVAYLTKETAIPFFILPFLMIAFIKDYRDRKKIFGALILIFSLVFVISIWIFYAYILSGKLSLFSGALQATPKEEWLFPSINRKNIVLILYYAIKNYLVGLFYYYKYSIQPNFSIAVVFLFAWSFTLISAIKGSKADKIMILLFLLFSPLISFLGRNNFRLGQGLLILLLSYLVTANFLIVLGGSTLKKFGHLFFKGQKLNKIILQIGIVILVGIIIYIQVMAGNARNINFLKDSIFIKKSFGKKAEVRGSFNQFISDPSRWISQNVPKGSKFMCDQLVKGRILFFHTLGDYPIFNLPIIWVYKFSEAGMSFQLKGSYLSSRKSFRKNDEKIIFISSYRKTASDQKNHFYILKESDLLTEIKNEKIKYIIISFQRNFLSRYFDANSGFIKIAEFYGGRVKIYKVKNIIPIKDFKTLITRKASIFLNDLKEKDHKRYIWFRNEIFQNILGWDEDKLRMLEERDYGESFEEVRANKIY